MDVFGDGCHFVQKGVISYDVLKHHSDQSNLHGGEMGENLLDGREVIIASSCPGGQEFRGTIQANQKGPHPFRVVDASGYVLITFPAEVARQLREDGVTSHMALVVV